nr:ubiquitin-conjugating enzyme E2 G1 isoform X1 [Macaca nemestrina]
MWDTRVAVTTHTTQMLFFPVSSTGSPNTGSWELIRHTQHCSLHLLPGRKIQISRKENFPKSNKREHGNTLADTDDKYEPQGEGGVFKAHLTFPKDYPLRPPKMKFITEIWHPNVDKNGDVCISILHEPGEDKYGYEKPEERWLPIHTVETIMISVISMLADPNGDSPANVDAAKEWREDRNGEFKRKVARCVRKSQETAFE